MEKVKWNISRDSPEDKLRDLLEWMKAVKRDTTHSVSLTKMVALSAHILVYSIFVQARLQNFFLTKALTSFPYV